MPTKSTLLNHHQKNWHAGDYVSDPVQNLVQIHKWGFVDNWTKYNQNL